MLTFPDPRDFNQPKLWLGLPYPSSMLNSPLLKPLNEYASTTQLLHEYTYILSFSLVAQLCPALFVTPMDCSKPGYPPHHQPPELAQTHVHQVSDTILPSHPLSSPSPPAFNLSQHQGLFQWVSSSHQLAKVLEFQFQHQSFQWIFRTNFL